MIYLNVFNAIGMLYLFATWKSKPSEQLLGFFVRIMFLIGASYHIVEVLKLIGIAVKV